MFNPSLLPITVLVVDDNSDVTESTAELVRTCGHRANVALTAEAALASADATPPDVVFLDLGPT